MVMVEGNPVDTMTSNTMHNGSSPNAPVGMQAAPSQALVIT